MPEALLTELLKLSVPTSIIRMDFLYLMEAI